MNRALRRTKNPLSSQYGFRPRRFSAGYAHAHKQTTKVNIGVVAGVLIFFALAAVALGWFWFHPYETSRDVRVKTTTETPAR